MLKWKGCVVSRFLVHLSCAASSMGDWFPRHPRLSARSDAVSSASVEGPAPLSFNPPVRWPLSPCGVMISLLTHVCTVPSALSSLRCLPVWPLLA